MHGDKFCLYIASDAEQMKLTEETFPTHFSSAQKVVVEDDLNHIPPLDLPSDQISSISPSPSTPQMQVQHPNRPAPMLLDDSQLPPAGSEPRPPPRQFPANGQSRPAPARFSNTSEPPPGSPPSTRFKFLILT